MPGPGLVDGAMGACVCDVGVQQDGITRLCTHLHNRLRRGLRWRLENAPTARTQRSQVGQYPDAHVTQMWYEGATVRPAANPDGTVLEQPMREEALRSSSDPAM